MGGAEERQRNDERNYIDHSAMHMRDPHAGVVGKEREMKWISANKPPKKDMLCLITCKRKDGSLYVPYYPGYYTIELQATVSSPIFKGFCHPDVVAWMEIPEKYTQNKSGWILTSERYPAKKDSYIVTTYDQHNRERVLQANFNPDREEFFGQPDVIAWMPIPKFKVGGEE